MSLDPASDQLLAAVTNEGRMLVFPLNKLPALVKGKGNKIIQIPTKRARERKELLIHLTLVPAEGTLTIFAGKRFFKLTYGNLTQYVGERGRRGKKLPRGFQNVDRLESEAPVQGPLILPPTAGEEDENPPIVT
jgi:topoisomerase-4 subunit A